MLTAADLQTAMKILRALPKGSEVRSFLADENGIAAELADGAVLTLKRPPRPAEVARVHEALATEAPTPSLVAEDPGLLPFHVNAHEFIGRPLTQPPSEAERAAPATPPTTMAKKSMVSFDGTFKLLRAHSGKLPAEARALLTELERCTLEVGDDRELLSAARAAEKGDLVPLRNLLAMRRPPPPNATAPPH